MIKFQNVVKIYPPNTLALDNVSFDVKPKEFVSVVGKSGAGKTTLLKLILAEEKPEQGRVFFNEQDIHEIKKSQLPFLRRKIGAVFQDYKLFPTRTAYENIAYVLEVMGVEEEDISQEVQEVLRIVGLEHKANSFPLQLSGGEQQRAAIARALVHRPEVILADEPTGNLDPYHSAEIIRLLLKIQEMGTTVILATHNKDIINRLGKRVVTLHEGRVVRDEQRGRFIL